ncbi:hypothetical protein NSQ82_07680 [Caldifermentibacillus hisashii]|uniref:hypothetical protein n=1 Tax=Caldifermentibacillus hisashii TaxID=996558 RepID=UPI0031B6B470
MTERLEEIKEIYRWAIDNSLVPRLSDSDTEWLIEQSEKVEELELEVNDWRAEVQKWQRFYKESEESHLETKELLKSIVNQNKRYRKVLEEIARDRLPGASYKARQALGSDEN